MTQSDSINNERARTGRQLRLIQAGASKCGVFNDQIAAVTDWIEPAPLPYAPASILGVVSIQGRMLTVVDLHALLADGFASNETPQRIIALRGDEQLAVAVDEVNNTIDVDDFKIATDGQLVQAMKHNDLEILVLNIHELFSTAIHGRERRRRRF